MRSTEQPSRLILNRVALQLPAFGNISAIAGCVGSTQ